jgi:hypothetical protein
MDSTQNYLNYDEKKFADSKMKEVKITMEQPVGSSGVELYSGYYQEEYLDKLTGYQAAEIYDKMRRGDGRVKMCLSAIKNTLRSATWEILLPKDAKGPKHEEMRDFAEWNLFEGLSKKWQKTLNDFFSCVDFGHSLLEMVDGIAWDHKKFGTKNIVRQLGWRSPKTLDQWVVDNKTGLLVSVSQIVNGDLQRESDTHIVMDASNLLLINIDQEGDNYEGISMLRPCYGPWLRKQMYLKLEAIGSERGAVGTPLGKIPKGKENSDQRSAMISMLKKLTSHQSNYALMPEGWDLEMFNNGFDPKNIRYSIDAEDKEMAYAVLANFLILGSGGGASSSGGSYSLGKDLSDFFLNGCQYIAELICEEINGDKGPIRRIIDKNYGPQEDYPYLACSGVTDKAGKEFSEVLKNLTASNLIRPDDRLEENLRNRYALPEIDTESIRETAAPNPFGGPEGGDPDNPGPIPIKKKGDPKAKGKTDPKEKPGEKEKEKGPKADQGKKKASDTPIRLADRKRRTAPRKLIKEWAARIEDEMQEALGASAEKYIDQIMAAWSKLPESRKIDAINGLKPGGAPGYKKTLSGLIQELAGLALTQARGEVPAAKKTKLSEFDNLPPKIKKKLKKRSDALVETQLADIEKAVVMQFQGSVDNAMQSEAVLRADLEDSAEKFIEGSSVAVGATNTASFVVNESRNAFFFDKDVLKEVHSFTFVNSDPVSPICKNLAGKTFVYGENPEYERYMPPLHHNCKSYLSPNLTKRPTTPGGLVPTAEDPEDLEKIKKSITLSE